LQDLEHELDKLTECLNKRQRDIKEYISELEIIASKMSGLVSLENMSDLLKSLLESKGACEEILSDKSSVLDDVFMNEIISFLQMNTTELCQREKNFSTLLDDISQMWNELDVPLESRFDLGRYTLKDYNEVY
jgi:hypothetical protein